MIWLFLFEVRFRGNQTLELFGDASLPGAAVPYPQAYRVSDVYRTLTEKNGLFFL